MLFLDGGITATSQTLTVNCNSTGNGIVLRNSGSNFSGNLIVNGQGNSPGLYGNIQMNAKNAASTFANVNVTLNNASWNIGQDSNSGYVGDQTTANSIISAESLNGSGFVYSSSFAMTLLLGTNNGSGTFSGVISNDGTTVVGTSVLSLTKTGNGLQTLSGTDTYTGLTTISGGSLQLGNAYAIQNSTVSVGTTNGLIFAPSIGTFYAGGLSGGSNFNLNDTSGAGVTLVVGTSDAGHASTSYTGALGGLGGLSTVGGTLSLGGVNSYSGTTAINGGVLSLANSAALAGGGNLTFGGGILQVNAANINSTNNVVNSTAAISIDSNGQSATFAGTLGSSNTGGLTVKSTAPGGILTLTGSNNYSGTTTLSGGTLSVALSATPGRATSAESATASPSAMAQTLQFTAP